MAQVGAASAGSKWAICSAVRATRASAVRFGDEAAQGSGTALGGLGEQHPGPAVQVGQRLAVQLGVLELEARLDAAFEGVPQGRGRGVVHVFAEA